MIIGDRFKVQTQSSGRIKNGAIGTLVGYLNDDEGFPRLDFGAAGVLVVAAKNLAAIKESLPKTPCRSAKQNQTDEYDRLQNQGYPQFEVSREYESRPFVKNRDTEAYELFHAYVKVQIEARLTPDEQAQTLVFGRVGFDIWAHPNYLEEATQSLRACGLENPDRYVKVGNSTHAIKFNLCLPNSPALEGLDHRLQTNFPHPKFSAIGLPDLRTIQVGKRSLCEQLIRDGILPEEAN